MKYMYTLLILFYCSGINAMTCEKSSGSTKIVANEQIVVSVFNRPVFIPNDFITQYYMRDSGGFDIEYIKFQVDDHGNISTKQEQLNNVYIQSKEIALKEMSELLPKEKGNEFNKCGDIYGITFFNEEVGYEFSLFYNEKIAMTVISSDRALWQSIVSEYFKQE